MFKLRKYSPIIISNFDEIVYEVIIVLLSLLVVYLIHFGFLILFFSKFNEVE